MISFEKPHANGNNPYSKPFIAQMIIITNIQVFLENNIAHQNQTLSSEKLRALLLSFKAQKRQDDS